MLSKTNPTGAKAAEWNVRVVCTKMTPNTGFILLATRSRWRSGSCFLAAVDAILTCVVVLVGAIGVLGPEGLISLPLGSGHELWVIEGRLLSSTLSASRCPFHSASGFSLLRCSNIVLLRSLVRFHRSTSCLAVFLWLLAAASVSFRLIAQSSHDSYCCCRLTTDLAVLGRLIRHDAVGASPFSWGCRMLRDDGPYAS